MPYGFYFGTLKIRLLTGEDCLCGDFLSRFYCMFSFFQVSLLSVVEIGVLPLICGWWLDICSLSMFDATLRDRESSFRLAPGTSMFIHWLVGMVYVYYFASFILLLREVLRPGVLWFLRNLNDPDFSPIQVCSSNGSTAAELSTPVA
jgi:E3 ubiquitin-protein ligase DOA10